MVLYLKSAVDNLVISKLRQVQTEVPSLAFQKLCFAFMNNDWIMIISSTLALATAIVLYMADNSLTLWRSES